MLINRDTTDVFGMRGPIFTDFYCFHTPYETAPQDGPGHFYRFLPRFGTLSDEHQPPRFKWGGWSG